MKDFTDAYREELRKVQPSPEFLENMKRTIPAAAGTHAPAASVPPSEQPIAQSPARIRVFRTKSVAAAACLVLLAGVGFLALTPLRTGTPFDSENAYGGELWPSSPSLRVSVSEGEKAHQPEFLADSGKHLVEFAIDFTSYGAPGDMVEFQIVGEGAYLLEQWSQQWARGFTANAADKVLGVLGVEVHADTEGAPAYYEAIQTLETCSLVITYFHQGTLVHEAAYTFVSCVDDEADVQSKLSQYGVMVKLVEQN